MDVVSLDMGYFDILKYLVILPPGFVGYPLLLLIMVEHICFIQRVKRKIGSFHMEDQPSIRQGDLILEIERYRKGSVVRRLIFVGISIFLLIYVSVRGFQYVNSLIWVELAMGPEGLSPDLRAESLRIFAYPVLSALVLACVSCGLYVAFTLWHEGFIMRQLSCLDRNRPIAES